MSQKSFADLGLSRPVVRALADRGITTPFAIQALVVEDVLDGVDVLAKSPTGLGQDDRVRRADRRLARSATPASPPRSCSRRRASS